MRAPSVAALKAGFSKVLADVRRGERIGVLDGRSKTPVAMIVPYETAPAGRRELGFLDRKVAIEFADGFEITEKELVGGASGATHTRDQWTS